MPPTNDPLVPTPQVRAEFGDISNSTLWAWVKKGLLPRPHHIRQRAFWKRSEIEEAKARVLTPPRAA